MQMSFFEEQVFGMSSGTFGIKVAQVYYGARNDLQGHLEAVMPSDAKRMVP